MDEKKGEQERASVKRRDLLKVISAVPAAALARLGSAGAETKPKPKGSAPDTGPYQRKVFNEHEWETIRALSDLIIPADERSGSATQAGVPEFIDDWLDLKGGALLAEIRGGLTWLDIECHRQFERDFVKCSEAQQKSILDRIAYPRRATPEDAAGVAFFNHLRDLVVGGFFSSKMGVKDLPYLGNTMVADWQGCPHEVLEKLGLSGKSSRT